MTAQTGAKGYHKKDSANISENCSLDGKEEATDLLRKIYSQKEA